MFFPFGNSNSQDEYDSSEYDYDSDYDSSLDDPISDSDIGTGPDVPPPTHPTGDSGVTSQQHAQSIQYPHRIADYTLTQWNDIMLHERKNKEQAHTQTQMANMAPPTSQAEDTRVQHHHREHRKSAKHKKSRKKVVLHEPTVPHLFYGGESFFASSSVNHMFYEDHVSPHNGYLFSLLSKPYEKDYCYNETQLFILPRPHREYTQFRIQTEPQILMAFESALKYYRESDASVYYSHDIHFSSGSTEECYTGDTTATYNGRPIRVNDNIKECLFFAWYFSPTFNWKMKCVTTTNRMIYKYLHDSYIIDHIERERLRARAKSVPTGALDEYIQIPTDMVTGSFSVRLEVIMLAYRYVGFILNEAHRDYCIDTDQYPGESTGDRAASKFARKAEDINNLKMDYETKTRITDKLGQAFSIMRNVVFGIISSWSTLEQPVPCAELTKECCMFMQYFIIAMRSLYVVRLLRIKHTQKKAMNGDVDDDNTEAKFEGLTSEAWAKLSMGVSNCFLKAYQIYSEFIDIMFGAKRVPMGMTLPEGTHYTPEYPVHVLNMKEYLRGNILYNMSKGFAFFITHITRKLEESPPIPVHPMRDGSSSEETRSYNNQMKLSYRIYAMSQYGLAIIRPLLVQKDMYQKYGYAIEWEGFFNTMIKDNQPKVTEKGQLSTIRPYHRIVDYSGIINYMPFIKDFLSDVNNYNYALDSMTPFFRRYIYNYPSETTLIYPKYIQSISYVIRIPNITKVSQTRINPEKVFTFDSYEEGKSKWNRILKAFEK